MIRTILMVLALIVLVVIGLFYMGVLHWPGSGQPIQATPMEVRTEKRVVDVPVIGPASNPNAAQPAPAPQQPAPATQPAQ